MNPVSNINPAARAINPNEIPLDRLINNSAISEQEKLKAVSGHFEAIFLRQFLMEAQKPLLNPKDPMGNASNQIYRDMMVNQLADEISKAGTFGLAQYFQQQLTPKSETGAEKTEAPDLNKQPE